MRIKISLKGETARERLDSALDELQARCTARTITSYDIVRALDRVECHIGVPAVHLDGTTVDVDVHAQTFPNAYRYTPESTQFTAENHGGHWTVTGIRRGRTRGATQGVYCNLSEETRAAILDSCSRFGF